MKRLILLLIFILITTNAFADKLGIPFSCYPRELQACFAKHGLKVDLSGNDRTYDSFGFIKNEGTEFWIYTYYNCTREELELIMKVIWESMGFGEDNQKET